MNGDRGAATATVSPAGELAQNEAGLEEGLRQLRALLDSEDVEGARRLVQELEASWPDSERARHYAHVLAPPTVRVRSDIKGRPLDKEWEWLRQHAHEYPGYWLAILGDELVAADPDGSVVRAKARDMPGEDRPLIYYQPERRDSQ